MPPGLSRRLPRFVRQLYWRCQAILERRRNRRRTAEEVFGEIYDRNLWGGRRGEVSSGAGTSDERLVAPYVAMIETQASALGFAGSAFVDLGCGDFRVGRRLLPLCSSYLGVDVVKSLVDRNNELFGDATTRFRHLDIVEDELPEGEVCFLRQVLQHLSNAQISSVLAKLERYRYVFITEHHPADGQPVRPNLDKVHGASVRAFFGSGVYLTEPPFDLPGESLSMVLELPRFEGDEPTDGGVIRTFLYRPRGPAGGS